MMISQVQVFSWDTGIVGNCSQESQILMSEPSNHTNLVHSPQKSNNLLSGSTAVIDGYTL